MSSIWDLRRSATDVKVAGVCGGIAQRWNVDPVLVRVGYALLALSGGVGLVLYLAAWLLIPVEGKDRSILDERLGERAPRWPREIRVVVVVLACVVSFAVLGSVSPFGFGPAVILAVIWYFGYYRTKVRRTPPPQLPLPPTSPEPDPRTQAFPSYAGPPTPFTEAAEAWRRRVAETKGAQALTPPPHPAPTLSHPRDLVEDRSEPDGWANPPYAAQVSAQHAAFLAHPDPVGIYRPEPMRVPARTVAAGTRSARRLRLFAVVVLGIVLTGLAVADGQGVDIPLAAYFAATLSVLGLTLIAATWLGRARGILPLGILLALATMAVTAAGQIPSADVWPTRQVAYAGVTQLTPGDSMDVGHLVVDLSGLRLTQSATYQAGVDVGSVKVVVPPETNLVVRYTVDAGSVLAFGQQQASGSELSGTWSPQPIDPRSPTLTLDLTADLGQIEVVR